MTGVNDLHQARDYGNTSLLACVGDGLQSVRSRAEVSGGSSGLITTFKTIHIRYMRGDSMHQVAELEIVVEIFDIVKLRDGHGVCNLTASVITQAACLGEEGVDGRGVSGLEQEIGVFRFAAYGEIVEAVSTSDAGVATTTMPVRNGSCLGDEDDAVSAVYVRNFYHNNPSCGFHC